jgi:sporulation and spore germination protein/immunoglobulin-like protein involved in spore germination
MKPTFVLPLILTAVLAACTGGSGSFGSLPPAESAQPSVVLGSPDVTPGTSPDASPSAPAGSDGPSASPAGTMIVRAYFFLEGPQGSSGIVPVLREIPATKGVATAALTALLAGPNAREQAAPRKISTTIPGGTQLLGLSIDNGVATVDLSREFESGGGSASVLGRLGQVVYTLTQFPSVKSVLFEVEGREVHAFGGEGAVLDGPVGRSDYDSVLPNIFVDRPAWGAALGNPGRVSGNANVFEATFRITLLDASRKELVDQQAMATCGSGCRGTFDVTIRYDVAKAQWGTLRVWDGSAKDGTPQDVREYPVWLTPGS